MSQGRNKINIRLGVLAWVADSDVRVVYRLHKYREILIVGVDRPMSYA